MDAEGRRDKARQIQQSFRGTEESIHLDKRLTQEAKAEMVAAARATAGAALKELAEQDQQAAEAERRSLEKELFGPSSGILATPAERVARDASYRDAVQRARAIPGDQPGQLLELMKLALRTSDTLQARACMATALERRDIPVLNAWIAEHPQDDSKINQLFALTNQERSVQQLVGRAMAFALP